MQTFLKYVVFSVLFIAGLALFYRVFHKLTKTDSKISQIKIEPYYPKHKDSVHYAITFKVDRYTDRLGIYVGDKNHLKDNEIISKLDTNKQYAIFIDETVPSYDGMNLGVRKISLDGEVIYKKSQAINLFGGVLSLVFAFFVLGYKRRRLKNGN